MRHLELYISYFFTLRGSLVDWCRRGSANLSMRIIGRSLLIRNLANGSLFCPAGLIFMNRERSSSFVTSRSSSAFVEGRGRRGERLGSWSELLGSWSEQLGSSS